MSEAFSALWASVVRTLVPLAVGWVTGAFATANIPIDPQLEVTVAGALTAVFTAIYYIIVRLLETYVTPKFGWLFLLPKAPVVYSSASPRDIPAPVEEADVIVTEAADSHLAGDTPSTDSNNSQSNAVG